jgi:DNA-binding beta-propeller fold protein YncE
VYFSGVSQGTNFLGAFNPTVPEKYSIVGTAANMTGGYLLNGLALDTPTGILYTTSLGHLQNGEGEILTTTIQHGGTLQVWKAGFSGSDGAFIDPRRRLFYVSELNSATVLVYNLDTGLLNNTYTAPGMTTLDDFGLDPSGAYLYGADLVGGRVVKFAANGTGPGFTVVDGLVNCTSVRFAKGPGFSPYSIFITEGGGQSPSENTRRVLEVNLSGSFEEGAEEW